MRDEDDSKDSLEIELEGFDADEADNEGGRPTPTDTREATNAAVFRAERYSKKAAYYSFKAYQIAVKYEKRLDDAEAEIKAIKLQGFQVPNALATIAFIMAFAALLLAVGLVTGRIEAPLPQRENEAQVRRR